MPLFVAYHRHPAESCPAQSPQMGAMLLQHVSPQNASKSGITIHGEAVVDGGHTLYLIVEASSSEVVEQFMSPFSLMGEMQVWPASPCEVVVARRGC